MKKHGKIQTTSQVLHITLQGASLQYHLDFKGKRSEPTKILSTYLNFIAHRFDSALTDRFRCVSRRFRGDSAKITCGFWYTSCIARVLNGISLPS